MAILNTAHRKLSWNGHLRAHTEGPFNHASKNKTLYAGSKTGAGMAAGWRIRKRSWQTSRGEPFGHSALQARFQATGSAAKRPRSGRPKCTNRQDDRYLHLLALRNLTNTQRSLVGNLRAAANTTVSRKTVSRRLRAFNLYLRKSIVHLPLTSRHR